MMSAIIFWQEAVKFVEGAASPVSILPTSAPFTKTSGVQCGQQIVQYCPAASVSAINAPSRRMRCSKKQKQTSPKPGLQPLTIQAISLRDFFARCVIKDGLQKVLSACRPSTKLGSFQPFKCARRHSSCPCVCTCLWSSVWPCLQPSIRQATPHKPIRLLFWQSPATCLCTTTGCKCGIIRYLTRCTIYTDVLLSSSKHA